jgi:head-tail adaptor
MRLDTLVTLMKPISTTNALNETVLTYQADGSHWADRRDVKSSESHRAAEIGQTLTTRFTFRWSPEVATVDGRWHLLVEAVEFDVVAVRGVGRQEYVEIDAAVKQ